jgi:ubiquinone biosynthesis protein COQ9
VLFPEGITQIVRFCEAWLNEYALDLANGQIKPEKIRAQIKLLLEIRIMQVMSKKAQTNHSAYFLMPANIMSCHSSAADAVDVMWRYAGDKSTDFNYYSKRGLLLGVYLAAKAYYFADESKDYFKTKEFIASSLDNIINIASYKNKLKLPGMEEIPILRLFS